jgi:hypothetical protein
MSARIDRALAALDQIMGQIGVPYPNTPAARANADVIRTALTQASLPITPGSSIWANLDSGSEPLILANDGTWGSSEGIPRHDEVEASDWTLIHDAGADS